MRPGLFWMLPVLSSSRPAASVAVRTGTARDEPLVTLVHTPHKTHDSSIGTGDGVFDVRVGWRSSFPSSRQGWRIWEKMTTSVQWNDFLCEKVIQQDLVWERTRTNELPLMDAVPNDHVRHRHMALESQFNLCTLCWYLLRTQQQYNTPYYLFGIVDRYTGMLPGTATVVVARIR